MATKSYVVVFPSAFSRRHIPALARNVRRILDAQAEVYSSIRRDGNVILVDAHDPVFASTAVGLLFGVDRTIIARQVDNNFDDISGAIADVGGNLLLAGDRFLVQVDGHSQGFLPRDVEMAATSAIIDAKSSQGIRPGTAASHDKLLYAYMTNKNAYVSLFTDKCLGGLPLGVQGRAICCIFDPLSALACIETIRAGFETDIVLQYAVPSQRLRLAKMLARIIPRMALKEIDISTVQMSVGSSYLETVALTTEILIEYARQRNIRHITLPASRMLFVGDTVDSLAARIHDAGLVPVMPLPGDGRLFEMLGGMNMTGSRVIHNIIYKKQADVKVPASLASYKIKHGSFSVAAGPNNLHDILDADW